VSKRAYVEVAEQLLERFERDNYVPGMRLPAERQLATELGVSRPTVREALAALELMGRVDTHVGAGTFVREPVRSGSGRALMESIATDASPSEILEVRLVVEPDVAKLAAASWDRQTLSAIARPLRRLEQAAAAGSSAHPTAEDRQFHAAIAASTRNAVLGVLLAPLWEMMSQSLWRSLKERDWTPAHTARVAIEHREIYDAVRSRDGELARFVMEKHLRGVVSELFKDGA
jgi:DNA-binding FadR family transcriptional regulator